jgi:8-hydroxy-5-deazaflavin:NADPH oxidoreductase
MVAFSDAIPWAQGWGKQVGLASAISSGTPTKERLMQIAIIGTGNVGAALGQRWAAAGHDICFGARQPDSAKVASVVKATGARAKAVLPREAAAAGGVVAMATPFDATEQAIRECGSLAGKIVIDCTNPLLANLAGLSVGGTDSGGEMVARWAKGAKVVKTLNTTGAGNMLNPHYGDAALGMFICGDDTDAKRLVGDLVTQLGFEPLDVGPLTQARCLEPLAMLWISMAYQCGYGQNFGFRVVRR